MPYKDRVQRAEVQSYKFRLWREMQDGFAIADTCAHCELPIYALDPDRHSVGTERWMHFIDPVRLGMRPLGKNDPVYDLVRTCATALRHRWIPEAYETHAGTYEGLDPRAGAYRDLTALAETNIAQLPFRAVGVPSCTKPPGKLSSASNTVSTSATPSDARR